MCKADAAWYSSRADLGVGFERAFATQSVLDDRLRIGLAELNACASFYLATLGLTIASWITPKIDGLCCELSELS
jgi:hypothetical protein